MIYICLRGFTWSYGDLLEFPKNLQFPHNKLIPNTKHLEAVYIQVIVLDSAIATTFAGGLYDVGSAVTIYGAMQRVFIPATSFFLFVRL